MLQQVTGINVFLYYAPEIFKKLGTASDAALLQTITVGAVNLGFTVLAIYTVDRWGRRPLMLVGSVGMGLCLAALGAAAYLQRTELWVLVFVLGYIAFFALSVGPVTWVILSEIYPTRVRGRALGLVTLCLWLSNFVVSQTFPMMSSNAWLVALFHQAFPFWVYAVLCGVEFVFVWYLIPETKGRTLEEIEASWRR
jgi:SP family xylose:H+ symportor-like MFS transporter